MNNKFRRAWAEVNLKNLRKNVTNIKNHVGKNVKVMAVVKADAYGHGAVQIAENAIIAGANFLAVACIDEAIALREAEIEAPILVLGAVPLEAVEYLFSYDITPTVFEENLPIAISNYGKKINQTLKVHIKLDTGMGRIGFRNCPDNNEGLEDIIKICELDNIDVEGIFTHFACADEENGEGITNIQFENLINTVKELEKRGINIPIKHCANSAAICLYDKMRLDMVRAGIILYGEYPSEFVKNNTVLKIEPVMELKAMLSQVKCMCEGCGISYGLKYTTMHDDELVATVCIGYADGYLRRLSNKSRVILNGKYVLQVGTVCMDQMMIDITGQDKPVYGQNVTLVGREGDCRITFEELASIAGTINYEMMCDIGKRVKRVYINE